MFAIDIEEVFCVGASIFGEADEILKEIENC
jgi:hypothetical protein